jgi:hypothetical protein
MKCIHCNQEHPDDFMFCPKTGAKIEPQYKACTNKECRDFGKYILPLEAKFCPRCGKEIEGQKGSGKKEETNKANGKKKESNGYINGHEYVDLGLPSGLKWATCNVGANSPEEYGDYYAWGETSTKSDYSSSNCPTYGLSYSELQSQGYIDSEGNLTAQYDAATANWGGSWRMPTYDELKELRDNCTWRWTTQNGVKGYKVEGPNGNSIFLPAAGYRDGSSLYRAGSRGDYWSSTPHEYFGDYNAYSLLFDSSGTGSGSYYCYIGLSVRPILE